MAFEDRTEEQAREEILALVGEFADRYRAQNDAFTPGDRIPYASRVYDRNEMVNLVDASLEFWLTAGRWTDRFEESLASYLGVRHCALVNSGSSANLLAFMTLTAPELVTVPSSAVTRSLPLPQASRPPLPPSCSTVPSLFLWMLPSRSTTSTSRASRRPMTPKRPRRS